MRTPIRDPQNATGTQIQPCRLPVEMPLTIAPILQPNARRELYPSRKPAMMPTTHCRVVSGVRSSGEADFLAVMNSAPARIPTRVMAVPSRNTDGDWSDMLIGWLKNGVATASNSPAAAATYEDHRPKP